MDRQLHNHSFSLQHFMALANDCGWMVVAWQGYCRFKRLAIADATLIAPGRN
jgi:hypothetical protein